MLETIVIVAIVAVAAVFAWKKLAGTASGEKACCEDGEDCAFKDFIAKEGKPERLNCRATGRKKT